MTDNTLFNENTPRETMNFLDVEDPVEEGINFMTADYEEDRVSRLASSRSRALERLNSGASLQDSYTEMEDGRLESNSNKIWNDMSDQGIQSLYANVMGKALTTDDSGRTFYADGTEYTGSTRRAYLGGTKDTTNEEIKFGLARSDKPDSGARYDPLQGGYASGERGIDSNNFELDVLLPYGAATMLESVMHGRKKALDGRVIKDLHANPNARAEYGGGASEYYKNREALFGETVEVDEDLGAKLFDEYMAKLPASHSAFRKRGDYSDVSTGSDSYKATQERLNRFLKDNDDSPVWSEIKQTVSALPAGVAKGAIDLVDAAQEAATFLPQLAVRMATGDNNYDIDLFDDGLKESVTEYVDSAVGYTRALDTAVMESAHKEVQAAGIDVTSVDSILEGFSNPEKRAHLGEAALMFLSDPSLTVGMITEVFGSGLGLGAITKVGAKAAPKLFKAFESNASKLRTSVAAAQKSGDMAAVRKLEDSYKLMQKTGDLLKGSVFTNADMAVRMNNDITTFKENNNGESPDAEKLFQIAVLNRMVSTAEVMSLKSLVGIKNAPAKVVKQAVKDSVVKATGNVVGKMLKGGVTEGVQETTDSIVEQLNQKLDSSNWEGKSAAEILSESSADIITGMVAGASSGVQLSGVSSTASQAGLGLSKGITALGKMKKDPEVVSNESEQKFTPEVVDDEVSPENIAERTAASNIKVEKTLETYGGILEEDELLSLVTSEDEGAVSTPKLKAKLKEITTDYVSSIVEVEEAVAVIESRAGTESEAEQDGDYLKVLKRTKRELYSNAMDAEDEPMLGSGYSPEDVMEEFYDTVDVKDGKILTTREEEIRLVQYAKKHGVPKLRFEAIVNGRLGQKDAAMVHEESVGTGKRSASTYKRELQRLVATPNVSRKLVAGLVGKIDHFLDSQENRFEAYSGVLESLKVEIGKYNKLEKGDQLRKSKMKAITNIGNNIPGYKGKYINVVKDEATGNLSINKNSVALIESVNDTIKYLQRVKTRHSNKINEILGDNYVPAQPSGIIVRPNKKSEQYRDSDAAFYKSRKITKVIVDTVDASSKWKKDGDYYKDNTSKINTGTYTKDDVVLINSNAVKFNKGKNKELRNEINKAYKAGATIVVDAQVAKVQTVSKGKPGTLGPLHQLLKDYHMIKVGNSRDGSLRYVREDEANVVKKDEAEAEKTRKDKTATKKGAVYAIDAVAKLGGDLSAALKSGTVTEKRKKILEELITKALPLFGNDRKKLVAHYGTELKKQTGSVLERLLEAYKYGEASPEFDIAFDTLTAEAKKGVLLNGAINAAYKELYRQIDEGNKASTKLSEWYAATQDNDVDIDKWVEANVDNPKGVLKTAFENASGEGRGRAYVYNDVDAKGNNDFSVPTKIFEKVPAGALYQVIDLDASKYVTIRNTTPLNSLPVSSLKTAGDEYMEFNELVDSSTALLEKTIRAPILDFKKGDNKSISDFSDSPAIGLLYNKDLKADENMAVALRLALGNYIRNSGYLLSKGTKTKKDIAEILNKDESQISKEVVEMMADKGMMYKTVANSVGNDVASIMGLQRNSGSDSDAQAYAALVADLGQTALLMGVSDGVLKIDDSVLATKFAATILGRKVDKNDTSTAKVLFIEAVKGKEEEFDRISALSKEIENLIPGANSTRRGPSTKAPTNKSKEKSTSEIRNDMLGIDIAQESKDALNIYMDTKWTADLEAMREMIADKSLIMARLGHIEIELDEDGDVINPSPEYTKLPFAMRQVQPSINRRIEAAFEEMEILTSDHEGTSVDLWFDYFFSKNGRSFIDSNTIQPQNEKQLHRFSTQPSSHTFDYTAEFDANANVTFKIGDEDVTDNVFYSLAQAFGAPTDKRNTEDNEAFSVDILHTLDTKEKIKQARQYFLEDVNKNSKTPEGATLSVEEYLELDIELEHLSHALQGFKFLDSLRDVMPRSYAFIPGKNNSQKSVKTFSSSITAEFDAVTSGFGIKNLQMPILPEGGDLEGGEGWRRKTGFIYGDDPILDKADEKSMNDVLDSGELKDSYQTLAGNIETLSFDEMLEGSGEHDYDIGDNEFSKAVWEALSDALPKKDEDGSISSKLRNLFKYPFMTFNYAASIRNIRNNLLVGDMMDSLVEQMAKVDLDNVDNLKEGDAKIYKLMHTFVGMKKSLSAVKELQNDIREENLWDVKVGGKKGKSLEKVLSQMINSSYGAQVERVLMKEFAPFIAAQDNVNAAFNTMFEIFSVEFNEKIKEARTKGAVTVDDERKIYDSLKDKWPAIKGPLSAMEGDLKDGGIGVYATETVSPHGSSARRKPVRAQLSDSLKEVRGTKDIRVSPMLKQLSAAISAGSVIPIHYLDGAMMSTTVTEMEKDEDTRGVANVFDAIIPPIKGIGKGPKTYNKQTIGVNAKYSFIHEINTQLQKVVAEAYSSENTEYVTKQIEVKIADEKVIMSLIEYSKMVSESFGEFAAEVNKARTELYESFNKRGLYVMHMAGTKDGVYVVDKNNQVEVTQVEDVKIPAYNTTVVDKLKQKVLDDAAKKLAC